MASKKKNEPPIEVSQNQAVSQTTPNSARDEYVNLLQAYHNDNSLTYDKLNENFLQQFNSAKEYDRQILEQALKDKKSPDAVIEIISQGIYVESLIGSDNGIQKVDEYLRELKNSYSERLNSPQPSPHEEENIEPDVISESKEEVEPEITPTPSEEVKPEAIPTEKKSSEAEEYALSLVQLLDQRRLNVDRLRIDINGETVFKMFDGEVDQRQTNFTSEHAELLKKALNDPASFDGTLKITQGSQVLLHVKDGRVLIDSVGLTKQSVKAEIKTPSAQDKTELGITPDSPSSVSAPPSRELYNQYWLKVKSHGLQATQDIATGAFKDGVEKDRVLDLLKKHDWGYKKLASSKGSEEAETTLERIVDRAKVKLEQEKMTQQQQSKEVEKSKSLSR
jgi:hypothetical protein